MRRVRGVRWFAALVSLLVVSLVPAVAAAERQNAAAGFSGRNELAVSATANIYGAGRAFPPDPGGGGGGNHPSEVEFTEGAAWVTVTWISGFTDCCDGTPATPPDGGAKYNTYVNGFEGISGVSGDGEMFLVGVFLTDDEPQGAPPAPLPYFDGPTKQRTWFTPGLGQVFFIGDGQSGARVQRFVPPRGATRLFLGFADAYGFSGDPGHYDDNTGWLLVDVWWEALCDGKVASHVGSNDGDLIVGTAGDDVIFSGPGDDEVRGGGGNDTICGGPGNDQLYGEDGNDVLEGGPGNDRMWGGSQQDVLRGGAGWDQLWGNRADDELEGGNGRDILHGDDGNDKLLGDAGDDTLWGGPDDDELVGGAGIDVGRGQGGTDTCTVEQAFGCEIFPGS